MLFYDIADLSTVPFPTDLEAGFGLIPNADMTVTHGAVTTIGLTTDTSANPSFTRFAGSGGLISLTWTQTPAFSFSFNGTRQAQYGTYVKEQGSGRSTSVSASATGSLIGNAVSSATTSFAEIDTSVGASLCIAKSGPCPF
jgi:hypothetical protein